MNITIFGYTISIKIFKNISNTFIENIKEQCKVESDKIFYEDTILLYKD